MLSGTRASIAIKLFGDDLVPAPRRRAEQIRRRDGEGRRAWSTSRDRAAGRRPAARRSSSTARRIARYGLRTGDARRDRSRPPSPATKVSQVLESQRTYDLVVRYRDDQRADRRGDRATPLDRHADGRAACRSRCSRRSATTSGRTSITRENVQRKIVVIGQRRAAATSRSVIDDIRAGIEREVKLPAGYYVGLRRPVRERAGRDRGRSCCSASFVIAGIFLLLFLAFRSRAQRAPDHGQPAARADRRRRRGVRSAAASLSVASLVGFITLFGIATRNGIMMISHYEHLQTRRGRVVRGGRACAARWSGSRPS